MVKVDCLRFWASDCSYVCDKDSYSTTQLHDLNHGSIKTLDKWIHFLRSFLVYDFKWLDNKVRQGNRQQCRLYFYPNLRIIPGLNTLGMSLKIHFILDHEESIPMLPLQDFCHLHITLHVNISILNLPKPSSML